SARADHARQPVWIPHEEPATARRYRDGLAAGARGVDAAGCLAAPRRHRHRMDHGRHTAQDAVSTGDRPAHRCRERYGSGRSRWVSVLDGSGGSVLGAARFCPARSGAANSACLPTGGTRPAADPRFLASPGIVGASIRRTDEERAHHRRHLGPAAPKLTVVPNPKAPGYCPWPGYSAFAPMGRPLQSSRFPQVAEGSRTPRWRTNPNRPTPSRRWLPRRIRTESPLQSSNPRRPSTRTATALRRTNLRPPGRRAFHSSSVTKRA